MIFIREAKAHFVLCASLVNCLNADLKNQVSKLGDRIVNPYENTKIVSEFISPKSIKCQSDSKLLDFSHEKLETSS